MGASWRAMTGDDLDAVNAIADIVHPGYPEPPEVPAERLALFPQGCFLAEGAEGRAIGYAVGHPGLLGRPPALASLLGRLPEGADCLYLHDVALLAEARGGGLGAELVRRLHGLARRCGFGHLALTAVGGSVPYWRRHGFSPVAGDAALAAKLASYGGDAAYMVSAVEAEPDPTRC